MINNISLLITLHVPLKNRQWFILWDLTMYRYVAMCASKRLTGRRQLSLKEFNYQNTMKFFKSIKFDILN